uniref:Uncharacterized protein n=1 Tax=Cajanus cajan TaxID=3821 RepID=A0A151RS39_CAJCA|nr:hypothetical protein KK1_033184 [Cajanus cajan]
MVRLRAGSVYTKAQLQTELKTLASCGMFEKVEMEGKTKADGSVALTVSFKEKTWPSAEQFRCIAITERLEDDYLRKVENPRPCLLPMTVQRDIVDMLIRSRGTMSARLLRRISHTVHKWYNDEGYLWANVVNLGKLDMEEIVCEVVEGDITKLSIQFLDKFGNVVEGNTRIPVVQRQFPMHVCSWYVYNNEVGKQVLRNLYSLGLFSNVEVKPLPDVGGVVVEVNLTENDHKNVALDTEWNIVPEGREFPILDSVHVGGTVRLNHRNLQGMNRSFHASVTTNNIFKPQDDLSFKFEYEHPYLDGVHNPRDRTLRVSCFNSRKVSPVFTGGTWINNVPPIWVDRAGIKANITEINFTRQSKFTYGLVMEEITTRDERRDIRANGLRVLPRGRFSAGGLPTTLSGTGTDRMVVLQTNITCDSTMSVNGTIVGNRSVFQIDQAIGISTQLSFSNRHQLTMTQFIQLRSTEEGAGKPPPPVLVLHGHYGGCVGDLPSYDAFTLGGPYSVRGFRMGEIGAARNILELAAELWIPIKGQYVYVFAEHGNDLGSSKGVQGNRTQVYRPMGHGSSYGVGIKLGIVRAEYAVNLNSGTDAAFLHFGERF